MKKSRSAVRSLSDKGPEPEPAADPYMDEAMAMVYVGDVYSLVAQEATPVETKTQPEQNKTEKQDEPQEDKDSVWPFIR